LCQRRRFCLIGLLKKRISGNLGGTETASAVALFFSTTLETTFWAAFIASLTPSLGTAFIATAITQVVS
jgi:hypothetical protein